MVYLQVFVQILVTDTWFSHVATADLPLVRFWAFPGAGVAIKGSLP